MIRSLNFRTRIRETERIERENHAFAKRLFEQQAYYKSRALDSDFKTHLKLKKQIQKVESIPIMPHSATEKRFKLKKRKSLAPAATTAHEKIQLSEGKAGETYIQP